MRAPLLVVFSHDGLPPPLPTGDRRAGILLDCHRWEKTKAQDKKLVHEIRSQLRVPAAGLIGHEVKAHSGAEPGPKKSLPPLIIAIDGQPSEAKAALATELATRIRTHHEVAVLHLEDIYPGWSGLDTEVERYISSVLTPLSRGQQPTILGAQETSPRRGDTQLTLAAEIIIVEGVGAAADDARHLLTATIWIDSARVLPGTKELGMRLVPTLPTPNQGDHPEDRVLPDNNQWLPAPTNPDIRVAGNTGTSAAEHVLQLLPFLPAAAKKLAPEFGNHRQGRLRVVDLEGRPDVAQLFADLYGSSKNAVWLDSSNAPADSSESSAPVHRNRFSILAGDDGALGKTVMHHCGESMISAGSATATVAGPFFSWLETVWGKRSAPSPKEYPGDFTLGWLGWLGYELKRETGGANVAAETPDAALIFAGRAVVLDHLEGRVWLLALESPDADTWFETARTAVAAATQKAAGGGADANSDRTYSVSPGFRSRDTKSNYKNNINAAQHEISEGNSYEVCLTTTLSARVQAASAAPWQTYLALRRKNPSPFGSYMHFGSITVASTSPERFLKMTSDGGMRAEPIKGTRRRSADPARDCELRRELETSLKDRAENIMIVDLLRNDLSQTAQPGTVTVSRLCEIESYATVHQMVSTIDAQLQPGSSRAKAVAACFPPGSMTGAPKISSMAILDRLEGAPRGIFSGAIGYFSLNGATDLAVTIRTLVTVEEAGGGTGAMADLTLGVGGAITSDSLAEEEYEEIRVKAFGVLSSLGAEFPSDE